MSSTRADGVTFSPGDRRQANESVAYRVLPATVTRAALRSLALSSLPHEDGNGPDVVHRRTLNQSMKLICTDRSRLVPLRAEHAEGMFALLSDPRIYEFILDRPPASLAFLTERCRRLESRRSSDGSQQWLNWIIQPLDTDSCAGFVQATIHASQTADFAFLLGPAYWGRGLAHKASVAAIRALFSDYALTAIFATADHRNARSLSLLTRLGFHQIERATYPHGDVLPSDHVFRLNRSA